MAKEDTIVSGMAGRYADALYQLARDSKTTDKVAADLKAFAGLAAAAPDLQRMLKSPVFSAESQTKALQAILSQAGISGIAANFIQLVAAKRRLFALDNMIAGYNALHDAARGVTRAEVTVAEPISDQHRAALETALKDISGGKSVDVAVKIDPSIIGGLIVKVGSRQIDGSIRSKLNTLAIAMKG